MKKLLLSATAMVALAFSVNAQNPDSHTEDFDSTAAEPSPCYVSWATGFTFPYNAGHDLKDMTFNAADKTMEMKVSTHATQHGPLYYKLSQGNRAACNAGTGLVDVSTENKFAIKMKASSPMQVIVYVQEGNDPSWDYSKFSNSNLVANLTTEFQVFTLEAILDSNQAKTASIDLSNIGVVAFELGKTDGSNVDAVTDGMITVDYMKFGAAVVGVNEVSSNSSVSVYPNPATDVVNVNLGSAANATVELADLTGKVVSSVSAASGSVALNTSAVPAGLYVVTVKSSEGVVTSKVVVK